MLSGAVRRTKRTSPRSRSIPSLLREISSTTTGERKRGKTKRGKTNSGCAHLPAILREVGISTTRRRRTLCRRTRTKTPAPCPANEVTASLLMPASAGRDSDPSVPARECDQSRAQPVSPRASDAPRPPHPALTAAIVGMRSAKQGEGVIGALEFRLSAEEISEIQQFQGRAVETAR